jgi:hypothetical protein
VDSVAKKKKIGIFIILIWFVKNIDIVWYMYMFIEFIISGYTSYTHWLVFISPLDNNKKNPSHLYPTSS